MEGTQQCHKCKEIKPYKDFHKNKATTNGFNYVCKQCSCEASRIWGEQNPEKKREAIKKWRIKNKEREKEYRKTKYKEINERRRILYVNNKNVYGNLKWRELNKDKIKIYQNNANKKMRSIPKNRLRINFSNAINTALRGNKKRHSWESLTGYNIQQLIKHIERKFKPGMTWDNYGEWHIDHIIPLAVFNFEHPTDVDFQRCWALKNLQPLWKKENLMKNAKIEKPFQPSLAMNI